MKHIQVIELSRKECHTNKNASISLSQTMREV